MSKLRVPKLCLNNGFHYAPIPECLSKLNRIEERLVAPRHVFQSLWTVAGQGGQFRHRGAIVNIPVNVDTTVSQLPRKWSDTNIIAVKLARKMSIQKNYMEGNVNVDNVWEAVLYLMNSTVYKKHNITINRDWLETLAEALNEEDISLNSEQTDCDDLESNGITEDDIPVGASETFFSGADGIRMAPGDGATPLSLLTDEDSEPSIFKSMVRHPDRRAVTTEVSVMMRKSRSGSGAEVNASTALDEEKLQKIIVILKKVVDGEDVTEEEAARISSADVYRLIQSDAPTCSRYFDRRFHHLKSTWKPPHGPFGYYAMKDYYYRIEFQNRGSPHVHMMAWLKDAPICDPEKNNESDVCQFADQIISCKKVGNTEDPVLASLVESRQTHRHSHTCWKKGIRFGVKICRFGIPFFPMDQTRVVHPFLDYDCLTGDEIETKEEYAKSGKKIRKYLEENQAILLNSSMTFDDFLSELDMDLEHYLKAIQTTISCSKVMLKRSVAEIIINNYSPLILSMHRANIDIQYIMDPYACYSIEEGSPTKTILINLTSKFYNLNEVSAQEASYNLLQLKMVETSAKTIYIPTGPESSRSSMLKPKAQLEQLPENSTDRMTTHSLMKISILSKVPTMSTVTGYKLKNDTGYVKKRGRPKIIKYFRNNIEKDPDSYFYSVIMLYFPWYDQKNDLDDVNCKLLFEEHSEQIYENMSEFSKIPDQTVLNYMEQADMRQEGGECLNEEELEEPVDENNMNDFSMYTMPDETDINLQTRSGTDTQSRERSSASSTPSSEGFARPDKLDNTSLLSLLNCEQRNCFNHIINHVRHEDCKLTPVHLFITGGAGTGKSLLIRALYQSLIRFYDEDRDGDLQKSSVALCAFTGEAAYNINGQTIHSLFHLPINQEDINYLSADVSNSLSVEMSELKVVILDEISMISSRQFLWIDKQLRDIFRNDKPFGGLHMLVFGDFLQLPPVHDSAIHSGFPKNPTKHLRVTELWHSFHIHRLTQIMRQRDDAKFALALNNMARVPAHAIDRGNLVRLHPTNALVNQCNEETVSIMKTERFVSIAFDQFHGQGGNVAGRKALLDYASNSDLPYQKTGVLATKLQLQLEARYMITCKIDTLDGLVNVTTGYLKKVDLGLPFPMVLAEALTMHKSQGATYQNDVLDLSKGPLPTRSSLYVACSRATSADGFLIIKNDAFKPTLPPKSTENISLELIRQESVKLNPVFLHLQDLNKNRMQLISHNVQSLAAHVNQITTDNVYSCSDILLFNETWITHNHDIQIPDFVEAGRVDVVGDNPKPYGSVCYINNRVLKDIGSYDVIEQLWRDDEGSISIAGFVSDSLSALSLYISPRCNLTSALMELDNCLCKLNCEKIILGGDFNVDLSKASPKRTVLYEMFCRYNLKSALPDVFSTTNKGVVF
ncbi:hypothetical protein INT47_011655 [Mucor saturninus]|uniref:ATP-dependent DNA helicase n=1 Tax=Mucor saturninus TaxID=64648 RepID=A0A8H7QH30_9FUNG|nr:hypothetical protein INT47_011655 [Mucor saturninus]